MSVQSYSKIQRLQISESDTKPNRKGRARKKQQRDHRQRSDTTKRRTTKAYLSIAILFHTEISSINHRVIMPHAPEETTTTPTPTAAAQAGSINEVAQAPVIKDEFIDQPDGTEPEPVKNPDVPHATKPDSEGGSAPGGEVAATTGPASSLAPQGKTSNDAAVSADKKSSADHIMNDGIATVPAARSFPEILYGIVADPATDDIISWLPHGRGFQITDKIRFAKEILPLHFDGAKFTR